MRRCLIGDILAAAAVCARAPADDHADIAHQLIMQADAAHRYAKYHHKIHPVWGNGSLMARAMAEKRGVGADFGSVQFLEAMAVVTTALAHWKRCARG